MSGIEEDNAGREHARSSGGATEELPLPTGAAPSGVHYYSEPDDPGEIRSGSFVVLS